MAGDHALNLKMVLEIEKHPCLYNNMLGEYSRKDVTDKAWSEVGKVVNLSGNECKERWRNLRSVFGRHYRAPRHGQPTKPKKPYYLAEAMQFALPFIKTAHYNPSGNYANLPGQRLKLEAESDHDENSFTLPIDYMPSPSASLHSDPLPPNSPQSYYQQEDNERSEFSSKKLKFEEENPLHEANRMFLLSLLPDVNLMTPVQVRQFKRTVMISIDKILENSDSETIA